MRRCTLIISLITLLSSLLAGCTGKIVVKKNGNDNPLGGIPFRMAESWKEYFEYTTVETKEGLSLKCQPQLYIRVLDNVPSSELYTIAYETDQWFERQKFAVTFHANGTLASVNVESTPPSPKELAEVAQIVAGLPMFVPASDEEVAAALSDGPDSGKGNRPPCTGTPRYIDHCQIGDKDCENRVKDRVSAQQRSS